MIVKLYKKIFYFKRTYLWGTILKDILTVFNLKKVSKSVNMAEMDEPNPKSRFWENCKKFRKNGNFYIAAYPKCIKYVQNNYVHLKVPKIERNRYTAVP